MRAPGGPTREPQHERMNQFRVTDNCLQIGERSITDIAKELNGRPFYAYDSKIMSNTMTTLRQALPRSIHFHYAVKANPMLEVVEHMANIADGLDVASASELKTALSTGTHAQSISFAGPGKSDEDLELAVGSRVIINIESETEMARISAIAKRLQLRPPVAIRVNPDFVLKSSGMKMGGVASPFGVDADRVPAMLKAMRSLPLDFMGFHIYSGSQNLNAAALAETHGRTFELALELAQYAPSPLRWLNIGGGLGVPYFPGEKRLDLTPVAANLEHLVAAASARFPGIEIVMELGRYLVAEAGIYVCKIVDRKISKGEIFLVTNGGLHHHLAASGNFGQILRKNYPACIGNHVHAETSEVVNTVGPLCTPLDILTDKMALSPSNIGDLVVIFQSGAYGFSASPHNFLSHPPPLELFF